MFSLDRNHRHGRGQLPPTCGELKPASLLHGAGEGSQEWEGSQPPQDRRHWPKGRKRSHLLSKVLQDLRDSLQNSWVSIAARSSLGSLAQEETAYLYLVFNNHFHWVCITAPSTISWVPSKSYKWNVYDAGSQPGNCLPIPALLRKSEQDSGIRYAQVQTNLSGDPEPPWGSVSSSLKWKSQYLPHMCFVAVTFNQMCNLPMLSSVRHIIGTEPQWFQLQLPTPSLYLLTVIITTIYWVFTTC